MNRQRPGKAVQQIDSWVLLSPLQATHVRSIYSSIERQTLLREAVPDPNAPQIPGYQCAPFHAYRHAGRGLLNHWLYPVNYARLSTETLSTSPKPRAPAMPANVQTMAYYRDVPWHGLGTRVPEGVTAEKMIRAAGMELPG